MTEVNSLKNYVIGTFIGHEASALHNDIIILLGDAMRLALRRPILHQLLRIHLAPVHFSTGKRPTGTFNTDRSLYDLKPWAGTNEPPHKPKVAAGYRHGRP